MGTHPQYPGVKLARVEFDLTNVPTIDGAYVRNVRLPTFDEDDVDLIMGELKSLVKRTIALEGLPMFRCATQGPAIPAPRVAWY
jgi:hypothetical protein